jgi:ribosomal protein S21
VLRNTTAFASLPRHFSQTPRALIDEPGKFAEASSSYLNSGFLKDSDSRSHNRRSAASERFGSDMISPIGITGNMQLPKMGPTAGRSIPVLNGDLSGAINQMKAAMSKNNVKHDWRAQRFHERPGLKRKRLRRERHRARFKEGFKRMVNVIIGMKAKGY